MVRWLVSAAVHLAANAIGLLIAAAVLEGMSIDGIAFVIAVIIFTVVEVIMQPFFTKMAMNSAKALQGGTVLLTTLFGLIVTNLISDGLTIRGLSTWLLATLIVWIGAVIASLLLPVLIAKRAVGEKA